MAEQRDSVLTRLFPHQASNDYRGSSISFWALILICLPITFRSFVHFLKEDSGANSIASIVVFPFEAGAPDPNNVIYMYSSLWGGQQLITLFVFVLILVRYRNLIPLAWLLFSLESVFRLVTGLLHPLTPAYVEHTPPGARATTGGIVLGLVMLALALRTRSDARVSAEAQPSSS